MIRIVIKNVPIERYYDYQVIKKGDFIYLSGFDTMVVRPGTSNKTEEGAGV
jgi:hypothetical protein